MDQSAGLFHENLRKLFFDADLELEITLIKRSDYCFPRIVGEK